MVILDTNIFSPLMRPLPDPMIVSWLNRQATEDIYITSVTIFEIRFGLSRLPAGQKRLVLSDAFESPVKNA
jgi:predicted nucleic acid-binding protein